MGLINSSKPLGVIGAGSFGTTIANLLAEKNNVLLFARNPEVAERMKVTRTRNGRALSDRITVTSNIQEVGEQCDVIFPIIPSNNFRQMMQQLAPYLKPSHILIHGTKGLDVHIPEGVKINSRNPLSREHVRTMSEVITDESAVIRVGCLAGPNLAHEIAQKQPAATVLASPFDEVIDIGQKLLKSDRFLVYGSNDLIGVELCGILKNVIAIGAGMMNGLGLGDNARSLLISRGLVEMVYVGNVLGGNTKAFLGLAGVGDLIATCSSPLSRNFTVGYRLAKKDSVKSIKESMEEVAEGVNTIDIIVELAKTYKIRAPISETLYKIIHEEMSVEEANLYLMKFPFRADVEFI